MKKIITGTLAAIMLCSILPTVSAEEAQDYTSGTQVEYIANENMSYQITVPALLNPGQSGKVTLSGLWPSNKQVVVTADKQVKLVNSINQNDFKVLNVLFPTMRKSGNNTTTQTYQQDVQVEEMSSSALFGTWAGHFNYNVEMTDNIKYEMVYKPTNTTTEVKNGFLIAGHSVVPLDSVHGDATYRNAYDYYTEMITENGTIYCEQVDIDFATIDFGAEGWAFIDGQLEGKTTQELADFSVRCYYSEVTIQHDFALIPYELKGETIMVPTMTIDMVVGNQVYTDGTRYPLFVYNEETMTFSLGTPETTIYDGMIFYTDEYGLLWKAATGEDYVSP